MDLNRGERLQIMLTQDEVKAMIGALPNGCRAARPLFASY